MGAVQERAGESGTVQRRAVGERRRGGVVALHYTMTRRVEIAIATVRESLGPIHTHWDGNTPCKRPLSRCGCCKVSVRCEREIQDIERRRIVDQ